MVKATVSPGATMWSLRRWLRVRSLHATKTEKASGGMTWNLNAQASPCQMDARVCTHEQKQKPIAWCAWIASSREVRKAKGHHAKTNPPRFTQSKQKKGKSYTRDQMLPCIYHLQPFMFKEKMETTQSTSGFPKLDMSCLAHFDFLNAPAPAVKAAQS